MGLVIFGVQALLFCIFLGRGKVWVRFGMKTHSCLALF